MPDPRRLRPAELVRLLNSTPLGEVATDAALRRLRQRAGLRIGDGGAVDLVRFVAWLMHQRHAAPAAPKSHASAVDLAEAAHAAAAVACRRTSGSGRGKLNRKQEALIALLLTEPTQAAAAEKAGVSEGTLYRWLRRRSFRSAYRDARRSLVDGAIGRIQAAAGQAVETLLAVARNGAKDGDRVRASVALLDHAIGGLRLDDLASPKRAPVRTPADVVALLGGRLTRLDASALPEDEKARLAAALAAALLQAVRVDTLDQRLEALQAVLDQRPKLAPETPR